MLEVRVANQIGSIPAGDWDALLAADSPPFLRHAFLSTLEDSGCLGPKRGWTPAHLQVFEDGKLAAAAPAYVKDHSDGEFVFDWSIAELANRMRVDYYPKYVVAVPFTPATGHRLLAPNDSARARVFPAFVDALRELVQSRATSGAHVLFPTGAEADALEECDFAPRLGIQFQWHNEGFANFDEWLGTFDAKRRAQIRRERREVRSRGIRVETLRGDGITERALDAMYRFYGSTIEKHPWGRRYLTRQFLFDIAERLPDALEIVVASEGERIVGGALNFASSSVLYGRYWGSEVEVPFLHFEVCYYHSVEDAIARKLVRFEPGAGGEHKRSRGFRPTVTYSAHLFGHAKLDHIVREYLAREREQVRRVLEGKEEGVDEA